MKYECVYLNAFDNGLQARKEIGQWLAFYNTRRPHSTFDGQTPDEVYDKGGETRHNCPPPSGYALRDKDNKTALAA